jgi:outer membrane protein OmpU
MNNLKKVGLSALAGSLVAMSAHAADISFSGGASIGIYQESENDKTLWYNNDSVTITVSGETDGGLSITNTLELDGSSANAGGFDNSATKISMDGMGTLTYARHGGDTVVGGWDSVAPTAYEEVWDVVETSASVANNVIGGTGGNGLFRYDSPSFSGVTISASYDSTVAGGTADPSVSTYADMGISISPEMVEGLSIGYASGEYEETAAIGEIDVSTLWVKYAYGPVTVSYQESEEDATTAANSNESEEYGISYAVTDDFSVSYGYHEYNDGTDSSADNQESTGFSASYTMAGTTIAASFNETDNADSTASEDTEGFEINVSFAF